MLPGKFKIVLQALAKTSADLRHCDSWHGLPKAARDIFYNLYDPSATLRGESLASGLFQVLTVWQYMMARIFSGVVSDNYADIPEDYHFHFLHCIDYVRQTIMCSADLALEAHEESDSNDFGPLDGGWSAHHGK